MNPGSVAAGFPRREQTDQAGVWSPFWNLALGLTHVTSIGVLFLFLLLSHSSAPLNVGGDDRSKVMNARR